LGRAVYYTAAYWVDGLMVDTGCSYTAKELVSAVENDDLDSIVNTHSHEDHIGANEMLSKNRGARIFAHDSALPGETKVAPPYTQVDTFEMPVP